jgi:hypothetical protein
MSLGAIGVGYVVIGGLVALAIAGRLWWDLAVEVVS